jgi:hypothetical protein
MPNSNTEIRINESINEIKMEIYEIMDKNDVPKLEERIEVFIKNAMIFSENHTKMKDISHLKSMLNRKKELLKTLPDNPTQLELETVQIQFQNQFQRQFPQGQYLQPQFQPQFPQGQYLQPQFQPQYPQGMYLGRGQGMMYGGKKTYRNKKNRKTKRKLRRKSRRKSGGR